METVKNIPFHYTLDAIVSTGVGASKEVLTWGNPSIPASVNYRIRKASVSCQFANQLDVTQPCWASVYIIGMQLTGFNNLVQPPAQLQLMASDTSQSNFDFGDGLLIPAGNILTFGSVIAISTNIVAFSSYQICLNFTYDIF